MPAKLWPFSSKYDSSSMTTALFPEGFNRPNLSLLLRRRCSLTCLSVVAEPSFLVSSLSPYFPFSSSWFYHYIRTFYLKISSSGQLSRWQRPKSVCVNLALIFSLYGWPSLPIWRNTILQSLYYLLDCYFRHSHGFKMVNRQPFTKSSVLEVKIFNHFSPLLFLNCPSLTSFN